jgi:hypothetical protein
MEGNQDPGKTSWIRNTAEAVLSPECLATGRVARLVRLRGLLPHVGVLEVRPVRHQRLQHVLPLLNFYWQL